MIRNAFITGDNKLEAPPREGWKGSPSSSTIDSIAEALKAIRIVDEAIAKNRGFLAASINRQTVSQLFFSPDL